MKKCGWLFHEILCIVKHSENGEGRTLHSRRNLIILCCTSSLLGFSYGTEKRKLKHPSWSQISIKYPIHCQGNTYCFNNQANYSGSMYCLPFCTNVICSHILVFKQTLFTSRIIVFDGAKEKMHMFLYFLLILILFFWCFQ